MNISFISLNDQEKLLLNDFLKQELETQILSQTNRKIINNILRKLEK